MQLLGAVMSLVMTRPNWQQVGFVLGLSMAALVAGTLLRYRLYLSEAGTGSFGGYLRALCVHDCGWYEPLAQHGYDLVPSSQERGDRANWAFFPLYPLLVAALGRVLGGDLLLAGFVVSSLATLATALLAYRLLDGARRAYGLYCLFLFVGPFSVYGSTLYTESLFMALTLAGFLALRQRRYVGAGLVGALLSATRLSGVFFSLAVALTAVIEARRETGNWRMAIRRTLMRSDVMLGVFLAPLGLFAFMAFLYFHTGDALAFSHIQRGWEREFGNPLSYLAQAMVEPPLAGQWISVGQVWALSSLIGLALCGALLWRGEAGMALFCALALVLPLMTGVMSMTRFVTGLAPLGLCAVSLLAGRKWTTLLAACLLAAGGMLLFPLWLASSLYQM